MTGKEAATKISEMLGNVTVDEIMGRDRSYRVASARQLTMWFMVTILKMGLSETGREMKRHHAAVRHNVEQTEIMIWRNRGSDKKIHDVAVALQEEYNNKKTKK